MSTPEMKELHRRIQDLRHQLPESRQQVKKYSNLLPVTRSSNGRFATGRPRSLRRQEKELEEQGRIWNELKTLDADKSHQRRVREIETEIQPIEGQLHEVFEALGSLFRGTRSGESMDFEAGC